MLYHHICNWRCTHCPLPIYRGHLSSNNSRRKPISHPNVVHMGIFREFEVWQKYYIWNCCAGCDIMWYTAENLQWYFSRIMPVVHVILCFDGVIWRLILPFKIIELALQYDDVIKWKPFRVTVLLCGIFTGPRLHPLTKASDTQPWCFLWSAPEQTIG